MFQFLALTWLLAATSGTNAIETPTILVSDFKATYLGSLSGSIEHFQGIKYAHDTSGEHRFAPPRPYIPEENAVLDASQTGAICPQTEAAMPLLFDETPHMSEDCLNLRIARPSGTSPDDKLPVVVWLHGGGVVVGSAYDSHFNPDNFLELAASDGTPVIYAALNYRMTIFGFSRLPPLKEQKSLNVGIRDQRLGLQWIKDHIHAFGGDTGRITVYGLSAGGTFAGLHTLAYGGEQGVPFQQAWMMSGPPGTALNMSSDATTQHTKNVAERLECSGGDEEVLRCLRAVPMKDLLDVAMTYSRKNRPPAGLFTFIPSVDDDLFPDRQSNLVRHGRFVKGIRMVFGWTQDDGATNVPDAQAIQSEEDMAAPIKSFASALSADQLSGLFSLYPSSAFEQNLHNYEARKTPADPSISIHFFRLARILRDLLFTCPSINFGHQMLRQSRRMQSAFASVRLYDLNQSIFTPMMAAAGMPYLGAIHGSDTPYIFNGYPEGELDGGHQKLAVSFCRSLIRFAYTGSPASTEPGATKWPPGFILASEDEAERLPASFSVQLVGGPYGSGAVSINGDADSAANASSAMTSPGLLDQVRDFVGMGSAVDADRQRLLSAEDLHRRCTFIGSLDETLGR